MHIIIEFEILWREKGGNDGVLFKGYGQEWRVVHGLRDCDCSFGRSVGGEDGGSGAESGVHRKLSLDS